MVARGPAISSTGALAPSRSAMGFSLFVFQRSALGFRVDGLGKVRMPRHQEVEVDEVEDEKTRHLRGGDIGVARGVSELRHLAEERAFAERHLLAAGQ